MRLPARGRSPVRQALQGQVSLAEVIPAPTKGWSASKSPIEAEEGTAIILDNMFPEATSIRPRKGYEEHATGVGGEVQTLLSYIGGTNKKMFAAGNGSVFDVSSSGAVGAAAISGLTGNKWQYINFGNSAGQYLWMCNGEDAPRHYNGTTWTSPAISGVGLTVTNLIDVISHKKRIWCVEKNTTNLWYLDVDAVAGTFTVFRVGSQLRFGGHILGVSSWSIDAGDGPDDALAVWSSEGEVLVYAGNDPASDYAIIGRYKAARPIGRRCMHQIGGDVAMISEDGILALSNVLRSDRLTAKNKSLTAMIVDAYLKVAKLYESVFGWQMVVYPHASMALLNVPNAEDDGTSQQFAYNVSTKAWARFRGWDAACWVYHDEAIYFGSPDGTVNKAETSGTDNGMPIEIACLPAFSHLGAKGMTKHVKMLQPIYSTDLSGQPLGVYCAVNFEIPLGANADSATVEGIFTWDTSSWDGPDVWGGLSVVDRWYSAGNIGYVISPYTIANIDADEVPDFNFNLIGWHAVYEKGKSFAFTN